MKALAGGNLDVAVDASTSRDEIGHLFRTLAVFRQAMLDRRQMEAQQVAEREGAAAELERKLRQRESDMGAEISALVNAAAQGDLGRRLGLEGESGFFHELAVALNTLFATVQEATEEASRVVNVLAGGDLTQRIAYGHGGVFATLKGGVNGTMEQLSDACEHKVLWIAA